MSERRIAYTGLALDRAPARRRDPDWLAEQADHPAALVLSFWRDGFVTEPVRPDGPKVFLGMDGEVPVFAAELDQQAETVDVRSLFGTVSADRAATLVYAKGILHWHRNQRFCGACGSATESREGGHLRGCLGCGKLLFPRIEPAVIMLVRHGERCLLARHRGAGPDRFATLAGFLEIGESLEDAVRREAAEEAGVTVDTVSYLGSQPWPFPAGLMVGFLATAADDRIAVDQDELAEARWFTRQQVRELGLTGKVDSIGAHLIETWLNHPGSAPSGA